MNPDFIVFKAKALGIFSEFNAHYKKVADMINDAPSYGGYKLAGEYLDKVFIARTGGTMHRQMMADLWFLLTGNRELKCESVPTGLDETDLPGGGRILGSNCPPCDGCEIDAAELSDGRCMLDLLNEAGPETRKKAEPAWRKLLACAGLTCGDEPYDADEIKPDLKNRWHGPAIYFRLLDRNDALRYKDPATGGINIMDIFMFTGCDCGKCEGFCFGKWYPELETILSGLEKSL